MQLLIIGNGFDLNLGLKSSFSDYITNTKLENWYSFPMQCQNFWCLLFSIKYNYKYDDYSVHLFSRETKDGLLWMDVESFIKEVCTGKVTNSVRSLSADGSYFSLFKTLYDVRGDISYSYQNKDINNIVRFFNIHFPLTPNNKDLNIYNYLLSDLRNFENNFCDYLKKTIENTQSYYENAKTLFNKLGNSYYSGQYIIDFNYTHDDDNFKEILLSSELNFIHGSIKKGAIIGFDSSNTKETNGIVLSKAWQKMSSDMECIELPNADVNDEVEIKFFGHSLGEQDYAYFHAIFDKYDIYNRKVTLTFIYDKYGKDDKENEAIQYIYLQNIYDHYAQRSGKEEEFRTIISRMQMENRLHIYCLDDYADKHNISKFFKDIVIKKDSNE